MDINVKAFGVFAWAVVALSSYCAHADFELGVEYYTQGNFEKAFHEFEEAAQYGDHLAQQNLGVMYLRGDFVSKDPVQAYAWAALAGQSEELKAKGMDQRIFNKLTDAQKPLATQAYQALLDKYSDKMVEQSLTPDFIGQNTSLARFRPELKVLPKYPSDMARNGQFGVVDVFFSIAKDGTTRDQVIFYSTNKSFEKAAIAALRQWRYKPTLIDGKPVMVSGAKNRFSFSMSGAEFNVKKLKKLDVEKRNQAEAGDASSKFNYAFFIDAGRTLTQEDFTDENPNAWYAKAAMSGSAISSYFLGRNILYGNMCSIDTHKSMGWLLKAAYANVTDAQYTLALEAFGGAHFQKDPIKGLYWLRKAAVANQAAQYRMAWILSTSSEDKLRNLKSAEEYLAQAETNPTYDLQTQLQTKAAVAAEKGDFASAIKWETQALKDAESLKLSLETSLAHLQAYQNKKPWREDI